MENTKSWIDGYKKFIITMYSISMITFLAVDSLYSIYDDGMKRDLMLVVIAAIGGIAGYHSLTQGKIDKQKIEKG